MEAFAEALIEDTTFFENIAFAMQAATDENGTRYARASLSSWVLGSEVESLRRSFALAAI